MLGLRLRFLNNSSPLDIDVARPPARDACRGPKRRTAQSTTIGVAGQLDMRCMNRSLRVYCFAFWRGGLRGGDEELAAAAFGRA